MFPSISKCVPAALVRSTFTANKSATISGSGAIQFFINGSAVGQSFSVIAGDIVSAEVEAPQNYSSVAYFDYVFDSSPCQFAAVTENQVFPTFFAETIRKRWYDFDITGEHTISYYDGTYNDIRSLGYNERPFDPLEIKHDSVIVDHSPNNFIIQQFDEVSVVKEPLLESWSVSFDGNNYLRIDTSDELTFGTGDFTIEVKIKLSQSSRKRTIITNYSKFNKNNWFNLYIDENNRVCFSCTNVISTPASTQLIQGIQQLLTNAWYSIAVCRQNGATYIFVNGLVDATSNITTDIQKGFTYIGHMPYDSQYDNYGGSMRCFRICKGESIYATSYIPSDDLLDIRSSTELLMFQDDPNYDLNLNVIPDPKTKTVYFYDIYGQLLDEITLPVKPIHVEKFASAGKIFFAVACSDRSIYKITVTRDAYRKIVLISSRDEFQLDWLFELPYETDIPFRGSFLSYAKFKRAQGERNQPNCISVANGKIWVGGYGRVWVLDKDFSILNSFSTPRLVTSIQSLGDSCIVILSNGQIRHIDSNTGASTALYSGTWVGNAALYNGNIYAADSTRKQLIKISVTNPLAPVQTISVGNFCPSYVAANNKLYIAGHDTNIVLAMDQSGVFERIQFLEKVSWITAINQYLFASHYLKDIRILKPSNFASLIPFTIPSIMCGLGTVGSPPQKIRHIGAETALPLLPLGPQNISWWVNGKVGDVITDGSYFSVSTTITQPKLAQFPIVIGDCAFDFIVNCQTDSAFSRHIYYPPIVKNGEVTQLDLTLPNTFKDSYACVDYGEIKKNFQLYTGQSKLTKGDVLSVSIPLGQSNNNIVSVLTVGSRNIYVPINPSPVETVTTLIRNLPRYAYVSEQIFITASGEYYIPYYDDTYKQIYLPLSESTITNLGGAFSVNEDISKINDDDNTTNATVPTANGLFDVYADLQSAVIVNGIVIYNNNSPVDIARPPNVIFVGPPPPSDLRYLTVPVSFRISASNDATAWTVIDEFLNIPNDTSFWVVGANEFNFSNSIPYRYWRFENLTTVATPPPYWDNPNIGVSVSEIIFKAFIPGTIVRVDGTPLYPGRQTILEGQYLEISMAASPLLSDESRMIIAGPKNYELRLITRPVKSINYINVGTILSNIQRSTHYFHDITITGTTSTVKLVSPDPYLTFSVDGGNTFLQTITINPVTQKLSIRKKLTLLNESSAVFYQELVDPFFKETYLGEVGKIIISQAAIEEVDNNVDHHRFNQYESDPIDSIFESFENSLSNGLETYTEKFHKPIVQSLFTTSIIPTSINAFITQGIIYRARRGYPSIFISSRIMSDNQKNNIELSLRGPSFYSLINHLVTFTNDYEFTMTGDVYDIDNFDSVFFNMTNIMEDRFGSATVGLSNYSMPRFSSGVVSMSNLMVDRYPDLQYAINTIYDSRFPTALVDITALYQARYPTAMVDLTVVRIAKYPTALLVKNMQYYNRYEYFDVKNKIASISNIGYDWLVNSISTLQRIDVLIDRIPLTNISKLTYSISKLQFRVVNKFSFYDGLPLVFLYNESQFYGFYDSQQEAAIAAVNAGHTPFIVYNVPSSSRYTYRRVFTLDSDCSVFPGQRARERLIQGG